MLLPLSSWWPALRQLSVPPENEAVMPVENATTQTDWLGDLCGGWALIRWLVAEGVSQREVVRQLGIGRRSRRSTTRQGHPPGLLSAVPVPRASWQTEVRGNSN